MRAEQKLLITAWALTAGAAIISIVAWGQGNSWQLNNLTSYQLFPVFGLLAFSLMWAHYVVAATRLYLKLDRAVTLQYFEITSLVVLAALLLHPGLLVWQLWRDGYGLPPGSYKAYVAPGLVWIAILGTISLVVFLVYELRRKFADRSWWRFVQYASDLAILAIFYHALRLGSHLQSGWVQMIWYSYGITLLLALGYIYYKKFTKAPLNLTPKM